MTDTTAISFKWQPFKERIKARWNESQSKFYIGFSFCLAVMSFVLASLTPDPVGQQYINVIGVVICVLACLFILGLPLYWVVNLGIAYAFFHMVREAIMTGGMFSNSLNWLVMLPIIPLFFNQLVLGRFLVDRLFIVSVRSDGEQLARLDFSFLCGHASNTGNQRLEQYIHPLVSQRLPSDSA